MPPVPGAEILRHVVELPEVEAVRIFEIPHRLAEPKHDRHMFGDARARHARLDHRSRMIDQECGVDGGFAVGNRRNLERERLTRGRHAANVARHPTRDLDTDRTIKRNPHSTGDGNTTDQRC